MSTPQNETRHRLPLLLLLSRTAIRISRTGIHPNAVSFLGAGLCITAGVLVGIGMPLAIGAGIYLLGSLMDLLDGAVAKAGLRKFDTRLGGLVDALSDKVGEGSLLLGLVFRIQNIGTVRMIAAATLLGLLSSYSKSASLEYGIDIRWPEVKVFGRGLRVAIVSGGLLVTAFVAHSAEEGVYTTMLVLTAFNLATFLARMTRIALTGLHP